MSGTRVSIALHRLGSGFTARIAAQLGYYLNADNTNIAPVLVTPDVPNRSLVTGVQESEAKHGCDYSVSLVGTYPNEANTLSKQRTRALSTLKQELDAYIEQIKSGQYSNLYLLMDFNFGYSGFDVSIARIAKEYLLANLQKADLNKVRITFVLEGSGGSAIDLEIYEEIRAVFNITICDIGNDSYLCNRDVASKAFSIKRGLTGISSATLMEAKREIEQLVGGGKKASRRLARKDSGDHCGFRGNRAPTQAKERKLLDPEIALAGVTRGQHMLFAHSLTPTAKNAVMYESSPTSNRSGLLLAPSVGKL